MEVDTTVDDKTAVTDGKRTKWQLPPSHHSLIFSPTRKSKFTIHKQPSRNDIPTGASSTASENVANLDEGIDDLEPLSMGNPNLEGSSDEHSYSFENIAASLSEPKISRLNSVARAEICPKIHRARLMSTKGMAAKISEQYGYEISNTTFLYAEEALYLLEIGKLEIYLGRLSLSVERARTLLLHSKSLPQSNSSKIKTCSMDEYLVYKHLSQLGYRVFRRDQPNDLKISCYQIPSTPDPLPVEECDDMEMKVSDADDSFKIDLDEPMVLDEDKEHTATAVNLTPQSSSSSGIGKSTVECIDKRGVKRKFGEICSDQTTGSTTPTSSAKDVSDDDDADEEIDFGSNLGDSCMDSASEMPAVPLISGYTVTEADSDIDIADEGEVFHHGVQIEELGYGYDGDIEEDPGVRQEPQPSTSAACIASQGLVDLADSDSDEEDLKAFHKVWSKFVPNATIQIGFPPSLLLPPNISGRQNIYEFDLQSREYHRSDSDLEYYVDELSLNSSPTASDMGQRPKGCQYKTWKEWRQGTLHEAKGVLNESLLGQSSLHSGSNEDALQKLHQWGQKEPESKRKADEGWGCFNLPFDLYHPSAGNNKYKLRREILANYVVAVVRNEDSVPSFAACDPLINAVPVLIALVSDESGILFMNPDSSPIPSLL